MHHLHGLQPYMFPTNISKIKTGKAVYIEGAVENGLTFLTHCSQENIKSKPKDHDEEISDLDVFNISSIVASDDAYMLKFWIFMSFIAPASHFLLPFNQCENQRHEQKDTRVMWVLVMHHASKTQGQNHCCSFLALTIKLMEGTVNLSASYIALQYLSTPTSLRISSPL
ncbi:hypothetical protein L6164_011630 [Bauhinia variegata]|uniref:Uncharacterized protein n=1 Tax=Bauhinia variegata TaxID=167791 RepID=A0ACB9P6I5_BAUVA|nr:hypothetical protein L6164_011630 [Bauhinia variegata]